MRTDTATAMRQISATIVEQTGIASRFCRLRLKAPRLARMARPGQFVEVRCGDRGEVLLRRPFGIHRIYADGIAILYEVVGRGTALLADAKTGDTIDIIGPLGNGFSLPGRAAGGASVIVAGGIGIAPLVALAEELASRGGAKPLVLIGAKTKGHIVGDAACRQAGCTVRVATDDGSKGYKGFVTALLQQHVTAASHRPTTVYACGPQPMLREVARIAGEHHIACQVSLEEKMACGIGVCRGCPVRVRKDLVDFDYKMVCEDGPVFDGGTILW